ncbi:type II toxin-antitoxin system RelE/ParE family toxin [Sphaerisporangium siamense]|uniref:Uncharacterized protein n=1 Tax=Sphaerisporangium siamense TaxID=795645 RepID=A0A7W7D8Q9_9ACTN|nr:hypothetical protein [Sphaerisporangium siamense]
MPSKRGVALALTVYDGAHTPSAFAFDPVRRAVLLVAGDKTGNWQSWYDVNIPLAEKRYQAHLGELETREYK